jgi:hypothetical protein
MAASVHVEYFALIQSSGTDLVPSLFDWVSFCVCGAVVRSAAWAFVTV